LGPQTLFRHGVFKSEDFRGFGSWTKATAGLLGFPAYVTAWYTVIRLFKDVEFHRWAKREASPISDFPTRQLKSDVV
jgi:hypothetical protein